MKKKIIMIAMISLLTASVSGCSADMNAADQQNGNSSAAVTSTAVETTSAQTNTSAESSESVQDSTAAPTENTDTAADTQQNENTAEVSSDAQQDTNIDQPDDDIETIEAQANQYGFYPVADPPATSISVASLAGTWKADEDIPSTLEIWSGSDIYSGSFTWTGSDGYEISGSIRLEYLIDHDVKQFFYTFYDNSGALWNAFGASGEVPLNDIYAGQSGLPHFIRN